MLEYLYELTEYTYTCLHRLITNSITRSWEMEEKVDKTTIINFYEGIFEHAYKSIDL